MTKYFHLFMIILLIGSCTSKKVIENYKSETLEIQKVADHVYQHVTFLDAGSFGRVACNGMIAFDENEAIIFDTPADDTTAAELISWVENELNCKIKAIIPTHFHADCLGGLDAFHKLGIPSYANNLTIGLARSSNKVVPENGFDGLLELSVGNRKVITEFFGEGHTKDNVIGYFPDEEIVFGGCLIKALDAGKGNLEDANVDDWPRTVAKLKEKYPNTKVTIPGHGQSGDTALFDYTISLFTPQ